METPYKPVACILYDKFESFATRSETVELTVSQQNITDIIIDVFSKDQAEFVRLKSGKVIRLDLIEKINGEPVSLVC